MTTFKNMKTSNIRAISAGAILIGSLATTTVMAGDSFELRLDKSHLNGAIELQNGELDRAVQFMTGEYKRAGLSKRNRLPIAIGLCAAFIMKGDAEQANTYCDAAVDANSKSALARNNRGVFNASKGDLDAAQADFEKALEQNPHFAEAKRNLERTHNRIAQREKERQERVAVAE